MHYWIEAFPFLCLYFCRLIECLKNQKARKNLEKTSAVFFGCLFLFCAIYYPISYYAGEFYQQSSSSISYIKEKIDEDERRDYTICIDLETGPLNALGIVPKFRNFTMQTWHSYLDETLYPRLNEYLVSGYAHYAIVRNGEEGDELLSDIMGEEYPFTAIIDPDNECPLYRIYAFSGKWKFYQ